MLNSKENIPWFIISLPFLAFILCLPFCALKAQYDTTRMLLPLTDQHGLSQCATSVAKSTLTFDPYMQLQKHAGLTANSFENRFQEVVWDTLLTKYALFPSWSDMRWNVPQYGQALDLDLSIIQALGASYLSPKYNTRNPVPYQHPSSPIQIHYVHHRLDRLRGLQFAVNFEPRDEASNTSRYNMLIQKSLNRPDCLVSVSASTPPEPVYILLPYTERENRLRMFLQNFAELQKHHDKNVILIISILRDRKGDRHAVYSIKDEILQGAFKSVSDSVWIHENDGDVNHEFSRGVALREAAKLVPNSASVLFQCDVDMIVLPTFFDRCRHNTLIGSQVYYPIFYSLYPYANAQPSIAQRNGFWRKTSFGMVCIRKGDFESVGAFDDAETRFQGWGSEDVYQYERIRNSTHLVAFRAVEPSLMHRWHTKNCDKTSDAYTDCMKTNLITMGDPIRIGPILLRSINDIDGFFEKLQEPLNATWTLG